MALAASVLLHLTLFVVVRWDPAGFAGSRGVRMFRLHLIEEPPEPAAPVEAAAAGLPAPEPSAAVLTDARTGHDHAGDQVEATVINPPMTEPVAESSSPTGAPAEFAAQAAPVSEELGADAPVEAGAQVSLQALPAQHGSPAAIPTAAAAPPQEQAHGLETAAAPLARGGSLPIEGARGTGSYAGDPGNSIAGGTPGAPDIVAVRRRIDARKVYPRVAVRNGWEGRVLVEMRVDGDGSLAAVRLVQGSGHAVLDEATLASVRRASPFPPAAGTITVPVEYRLIP